MADVAYETEIYRKRLLRRSQRIVAEMLRDWNIVERDLLARANLLAAKIEEAVVAGQIVEPVWLFQQERYAQLITQVRLEQERLNEKYGPYLEAEMRAAALDGAMLAARQLAVSTAFATSLSTTAVEAIAAATRTKQLADILATIDAEGVFRDALVKGVARGANPREIARAVKAATKEVAGKQLTIARTEVARAQRYATLDSYKAAGIGQWQWSSARDSRTCAACWAMDGTPFPIDTVVSDHPNGRCQVRPLTDSIPIAELRSREQAWNALSESEKRQILGPTRYDLLQKNQVNLKPRTQDNPNGIADYTTSTDWGTSIRVGALT